MQGFKGHAQVIFDLWPFKSFKGFEWWKTSKRKETSGGEIDPYEQTDILGLIYAGVQGFHCEMATEENPTV